MRNGPGDSTSAPGWGKPGSIRPAARIPAFWLEITVRGPQNTPLKVCPARSIEKTGNDNACHPQTADSAGKTDDPQTALQMALQILAKLPPDRLAAVLAELAGEVATK
jgi:hypothetical protein